MSSDSTFAAAAAAGLYYSIICTACRREARITARAICASGQGEHRSWGFHQRLRCQGCGVRGRATLTINGAWCGRYDMRPADWAETVDERLG